MSRTKHHSLHNNNVKIGEGKKRRACGYEYWGRRPTVGCVPDISRERAIAKQADIALFQDALDVVAVEWVDWEDILAD